MKKILILSVFAAAIFTGCRKKDADVSTLYTYSTPTITVSGEQYYSIPIGGALPNIVVSAYDSFYHESYPVILDQSTLDNATPGLYVVTATSRNKYGMEGNKSVYVAVTDIDAATNISGQYKRTSNSVIVNVTKLANGLYMTDNVGGVDSIASPSSASAVLAAFFVQTSPTEILIPTQPSAGNTLSFSDAALDVTGPVTFQYKITGPTSVFGPALRTFVKQ